MSLTNFFELLCGMALFMFGMSLMGDGLKRVAGNQLERLLAQLTSTPIKGILLGTGVTAIIQSSSATSVMTVGFVNSGMMKFQQAIGIILGAILGTSITGWIICLSEINGGGWVALFSTTTLTGIISLIGILFRMFSKRHSNIGDILLGFVVLMVGIGTMSSSVSPLAESSAFIGILTMFKSPVLGIIAGMLFTGILQSASAAVGVLQALSATGAIDFEMAYPIILGISIGAALPVLLSSVSSSTEGKRTSFVYLLICVLGVVLCGTIYYGLNLVIDFPFADRTMNAFSIALVNTLFRLGDVILLFPFIKGIEKLTCMLIKEKPSKQESGEFEPIKMEEKFLQYPALAISQSQRAIYDMATKAQRSVTDVFMVLEKYDETIFHQTEQLEKLADRYEDSIGTYLMKLSTSNMTKEENADVFKYLHTLSDFERITDHAMNIAHIARKNREKNIFYSEAARNDIKVLQSAVEEIMELTVTSFVKDQWKNDGRVAALNSVIHTLCNKAEFRHVQRLQSGNCTIEQGTSFGEALTNFEQISVHCVKIVRAMAEVHADSYRLHAAGSVKNAATRNSLAEQAFEKKKKKYQMEELNQG